MKPRIYVSHSIRGKFGKDATREQMAENCRKAIRFGKYLKECFPEVDWYVPADHDEFVAIAYKKNYLTERQILDVDCTLIKDENCKGVMFYMPDDYLSGGMTIEHTCCDDEGKLQLHVTGADVVLAGGVPTLSGYQLIAEFVERVINE